MVQSNLGRIKEVTFKEKIKIDAKDKKILTLLEENSRMSLTQMAKSVALSRDGVNYRIKRLMDKKVVLGFIPEINFELLGYETFHVFLLIDERDLDKKKAFIESLKKHPNIFSVIEYSDRWDLRIVLLAKNLKEYNEIMTDLMQEYQDVILDKEHLVVIDEFYSTFLPVSFQEKKNKTNKEIKKARVDRYQLDSNDVAILKVLSKNCRLSTYEISKEVELSPDAIGYRLKKLYNSGVIKSYTCLVNLSNIGYSWYTYGIEMRNFDKIHQAKFKEFVREHPYIIKAAHTLGSWDVLMFIVTESGAQFHETTKKIKNEFHDVIKEYETWVAYCEHYFECFPEVLQKELAKK